MRDDHTISLKYEPRPEPPPAPPPPPVAPRKTPPRWRKLVRNDFVVYGVILALLCGGFFAWWSWPVWFGAEQVPSETEDARAAIDDDEIISRIGELIVLPEGEDPTIAKVTDPEKLRDQVFFANAKEGDVVLIYTKAQKAYLYDPGAHKLIEVAPLTIQ